MATLEWVDQFNHRRFLHSQRKAARIGGRKSQSLKVRVETVDRARLRTSGWTGRLMLYGRADFDGDGLEDLLLRRDAHVTEGTASDSTVFIVTQTSSKRCARVIRRLGTAPQ